MIDRLPNLFESYEQPENRLTFALLRTLVCHETLIRGFIRCIIPEFARPRGRLGVFSQRRPPNSDEGVSGHPEEVQPTVPDGWLVADDALVALEVKLYPGTLKADQLAGHVRALKARDAAHKALLILTPDEREPPIVEHLERFAKVCAVRVRWAPWRKVHSWVCGQIEQEPPTRDRVVSARILCLKGFREYLEMKGLSGFTGVTFDNGYDYLQAKGILRQFRAVLAGDVARLYAKLRHGKKQIGDDRTLVWDVFASDVNFTAAPHFTISIHDDGAWLSLTVPNGAGKAWGNLVRIAAGAGRAAFRRALADFLSGALRAPAARRPAIQLKLMQRHFANIGAHPDTDAQIIVRLDTAPICPSRLRDRAVKRHAGWCDAALDLLGQGRNGANWEFQIQAHFDIGQPIMGSPELRDEFVRILKAFRPVYELLAQK